MVGQIAEAGDFREEANVARDDLEPQVLEQCLRDKASRAMEEGDVRQVGTSG
jgi:hypothetical protein